MTDRSVLEHASPYTPQQESDIAASSEEVYSSAADAIVEDELRSLGRDFLALTAIFLIIATYHVQNPLLQFETQLGRAFRNQSLQVVLALGLAISIIALVGWRGKDVRAQFRRPLHAAAVVVLAAYSALMLVAIVGQWNPLAVLYGIDPALMRIAVDDPALAAQLHTPLLIAMAAQIAAIVAVIVLWSPWSRLKTYRREARKQFAVIVVAIVILLLWEGVIALFNIQQFLLPSPTTIAGTF
ncbi:MAG TPA: hypothetical protein VER79_00775, partial [Candidatus Limnocylindrales bacterium]|nr:hypothetical protein [Candidatus Limnocylindrales bacterium]